MFLCVYNPSDFGYCEFYCIFVDSNTGKFRMSMFPIERIFFEIGIWKITAFLISKYILTLLSSSVLQNADNQQ